MINFKNTSKLFKTKLIVGVVITLVAIVLLAVLLPLAFKTISSEYPIVVIKTKIEKGQKISEDMLSMSKTSDKQIADKVAKKTSDIVNKYACVDLLPKSHVLSDAVSSNEIYPDVYSNLKNGYVTLSVTFDGFATSMSGKIRKGDIATVFATKKENEGTQQSTYATIPDELRYVEVVAVTDDNNVDVKRKDDTSVVENIPTTATLLVTEQQASILVDLEKDGYLHFGLACRNDDKRSAFLLEMQKATIAEKNAKLEKGDIDV